MRYRRSLSVFTLLAVASLPAQSILTVGYSGQQFTSLQAAVNAATPGDRIVVAPGAYSLSAGLVVNKGISILGGPNTQLSGGASSSVVRVTNLPAGATFVLDGFQVFGNGGSFSTYPVELDHNQGSVLLSNVEVNGGCSNPFSCDWDLRINACAQVVLSNCTVRGLSVTSYYSNVTINQCDLKGRKAKWSSAGYGMSPTNGALLVYGSVSIMGSRIVGGDGDVSSPPWAGLGIVNCNVKVAGDANSVIGAGLPGTASAGREAIEMGPGILLLDPGVALVPQGGAAAIRYLLPNPGTVTIGRPLGLAVVGNSIGGPMSLLVRSDVQEVFGIFAALAAGHSVPSPYGPVWLDPATFFCLSVGIQGAAQMHTTSVAVPNDPTLFGATFAFAALGGGASQPWRLSNHDLVMFR